MQEFTDGNADIDIKTNSKASKITRAVSAIIDGSKISAGKNIKYYNQEKHPSALILELL
jgi:hypothetical protein